MMRVRWPGITPSFLVAAALLALGLAPLPLDNPLRLVRQSARSLELNRADREGQEAGYYEGLINVDRNGSGDELALRLLGKPSDWVDFHDLQATKYTRDDILQFELFANLSREAFGSPFTTNSYGLRDREYATSKPAGTFRIALLGVSIDMGWGVAGDETYENRLEDWLNLHAQKRGLARRFEVLNFSMAAYSPLQRVEAFRRKAAAFQPDLVLYSGTTLDERLMQIHLCDLLASGVDLDAKGYAYVMQTLRGAGLTPELLAHNKKGQLAAKDRVKAIVASQFWPLIDGTLAALTANCRSSGVPLYVLLVPRAGESDMPSDRAPVVARYTRAAHERGLEVIDLTEAFDGEDPSAVSLAPWDDHPNSRGHKLLFRQLANRIAQDPALYELLFGVAPLAFEPTPDDFLDWPLGPEARPAADPALRRASGP